MAVIRLRTFTPKSPYMFTPKAVRISSIIAIILTSLGLLLTILLIVIAKKSGLIYMGLVTWAVLIWASILGYQLSNYHLYEDEYKKVGIRIYLIIGAFLLYFFAGLILGIVISFVLLGSLWSLKKNYDEWDNTDQLFEDTNTSDQISQP
ncbi:MAG: hypothetical protein C5B59_10245 [Bacteroidetes bacterium]|nr:MAG: hypothetical protein C5B59_10245 [Bacteroidota bacterium]